MPDCDLVLLTPVEPGFGGQAFMADMMPKVRAIKSWAPQMTVEVDGGINKETIRLCAESGADVAVAGTSVFRAPDVGKMIEELKAAAQL